MRFNFVELQGPVLFTTQINELYYMFGGDKGYYNFTLSSSGEVIFSARVYRGTDEVVLSGLGDVIRSWLDNKKRVTADFNITMKDSSGTNVSRDFSIIRRIGRDDVKAFDFTQSHFLTDQDVWLIPHELWQTCKPKVYAYSDNADELVVWTHFENNASTWVRFPATSEGKLRSYDPSLSTSKEEWPKSFSLGDRTLQIKFRPFNFGCFFIFKNSFGIEEPAYFPGVLTKSHDKAEKTVILGGVTRYYDIDVTDEMTLTIEQAPQWMVNSARVLLMSSQVDLVENVVSPSPLGRNIPVIIKSISGDITDNPSKLSNLKITFSKAVV